MCHARTLSLLTIAVFALAASASAQPTSSDAESAQALRAGGHVIVFRHGATHSDQADIVRAGIFGGLEETSVNTHARQTL